MAVAVPAVQSFAYEAQNQLGQVFKGTLEGRSASEVQERLSALALRVVSVEVQGEGAMPRRGRGLGADDFLAFNQQLAFLTRAGLPVERGLRLIALDMRSGRLAKSTEAVAKELEAGVPLAEAFGRHAGKFPPLYGNLMEVGVATGNLPGMLFNLGRHLELMGRLRRELWRTVSYPLMVLGAVALILLFISLIVLPRFADMYRDFSSDLPLLTLWLLAFGRVYPYVFAVGVGLIVLALVVRAILHVSGVRLHVGHAILLRTPFIGPGLKANLLARWIDAVRLGVEGGLDLPRAVGMAAEATGGRGLERDAKQLAGILAQGQPLTVFRGQWIPQAVPAAMELASATGDLGGTLATLSRMYEQQAEFRLRTAPGVLTPVLMLVVGSGVTLCISALFLPIIKLIQSVSGGD